MSGQVYDVFGISVGRGDRAGVAHGVFFLKTGRIISPWYPPRTPWQLLRAP